MDAVRGLAGQTGRCARGPPRAPPRQAPRRSLERRPALATPAPEPRGCGREIQASVDRLRVNRLGPAQGHGVWNAKGGAETQLLSGVVGTELSDPGRMASASASSRLWPACGRAS